MYLFSSNPGKAEKLLTSFQLLVTPAWNLSLKGGVDENEPTKMETGELELQTLSRKTKRCQEGQRKLQGIWNSFHSRKN